MCNPTKHLYDFKHSVFNMLVHYYCPKCGKIMLSKFMTSDDVLLQQILMSKQYEDINDFIIAVEHLHPCDDCNKTIRVYM